MASNTLALPKKSKGGRSSKQQFEMPRRFCYVPKTDSFNPRNVKLSTISLKRELTIKHAVVHFSTFRQMLCKIKPKMPHQRSVASGSYLRKCSTKKKPRGF